MLRTLSAKLAAVLLALLFLIGVLYIGLTLFSTQMYMEEVNQKLNRTLAQHLVSEKVLMEGSQVNRAATEEIFNMLMLINPSIEIYLLDKTGVILASSGAAEKLQRSQVSLAPIKTFLRDTEQGPILGDDPLHPTGHKVFSAAAIPVTMNSQQILPVDVARSNDKTALLSTLVQSGPIAGYLYVVLAGQAYDTITERVQRSHILRLSMGAGAVSLIIALFAGLLLFRYLTRRLTRLSSAMETFTRQDFVEPNYRLQDTLRPLQGGDEIDKLGSSFHHMAERILQQMHSLKQTDTLRRELVANVSHDLRTPLASLQGYLETLLLKEGKLTSEEQHDYLEIAARHSIRLGKLVSELFELAKLDSQMTPLQPEPFSLGELVQDVVQKFQLRAQDKSVKLDAQFRGNLPFVRADIGLIERVLENLIENALHYTPEGGVVTVTLQAEYDKVTAEVSDTGCGIPEEDIPFIFDRFYRVEKARQQYTGGSGLGLAIAKRILELHGSSIEAHSVIDRGSSLKFYLPVAQKSLGVRRIALADFSHEAFDAVLRAHVHNGLVDYSVIANDTRFEDYLYRLSLADISSSGSRAQRLAYWINAYNAFAIHNVLEGYSTRNAFSRYRFFTLRRHQAGGESINLYDIEHKILIPEFHEPRMHFALVCASASCPRLRPEAFHADDLETQLEEGARAFINDPVRNRVDLRRRIVYLSKIFHWFEKDFTAHNKSLVDYLREFSNDPVLARELSARSFTVEFLDYDWSLNGLQPATNKEKKEMRHT